VENKMVESAIKVATGSISNRVDAYNFNNHNTNGNMQFLGIDGWTPQNKEYRSIGDRRVTSLTLGTYGLGGMVFNTQRLVKTLKPRVEESLLRIEEYSNEIGNTNKILYTTLFATGTSASTTPIVAEASRSRGLTSMIFGVIPSNLSEGYQRLNCIYSFAMLQAPLILVNEDFAESVATETRIRANNAAGMDPSKYYINAQFSMEFCKKIARIISGLPEKESKQGTTDNDDDLGFLDVKESCNRNMSVELESAIGKRPEIYCLHYSHSQKNEFEELAILRPSVKPSADMGNPLIFVEYDTRTSEDEVGKAIMTSLEMQNLKPERIFFVPSTVNNLVALVPSGIPPSLKQLINHLTKGRPLKEIMEKVAKRTILSSVPPIRLGSEQRIIKEQLSNIFYNEKSEIEALAKSQGLSMDWNELTDHFLLYYLAENHDTYLRPIRGDIR
jgi:hypothetical protein